VSELFSEVDEELRREQLRNVWERYGWLILTVAALIVLGVGGWRGYQYLEAQKATEAGTAFEAAVTLAEQNKRAEAEAAFLKVASEGTSGYRGLARLRAAAEAATRDPQAAVKLYDAIAADASLDRDFRDLAALRAGSLSLDSAAYADVKQRLEPLAAQGRTFRHSAREVLALSAWRAGDAVAARQWIDMIAADDATPSTLKTRVESLQALLPPVAKG
jgi:hypothetical protein